MKLRRSRSKPLEEMTEAELADLMTACARAVEDRLPPGPGLRGKAVFVLLIRGQDGVSQYVSNCGRYSVIRALRQAADRLERREDMPR